ncbi:MAG: hypothetical protein ACTSX7_12380 [Alphaproteobacteria bacterium]
MHMEDLDLGSDRRGNKSSWQRTIDKLGKYLRSRTTDHWIMFLAGAVIGALLA